MKKKKNNLKETKIEDLKKRLHELEEKKRNLKFKMEGAKSKNVKEMMTLRREVARILTEINSRENK
ncbi:MAG: 50S ribosomal protein L29 [Candidatus Paceibacterota bacterium]|jgi:ribosomal protein L29